MDKEAEEDTSQLPRKVLKKMVHISRDSPNKEEPNAEEDEVDELQDEDGEFDQLGDNEGGVDEESGDDGGDGEYAESEKSKDLDNEVSANNITALLLMFFLADAC